MQRQCYVLLQTGSNAKSPGTTTPFRRHLGVPFVNIYDSLVQVMAELAQKDCVPCKGGAPPLKGNDLARLAQQLGEGWRVINEHHLEREFKFENFRKALDFTNQVGELAEQQNHHPDIYLAWGKVRLTLWTHKIDGLTESDFVFAAKVNQIQGKSEG
jgi:4a-hydroxytetrahydrobiopterin dehydratase